MFSTDLARYGPEAAAGTPFTLRQSRRYCRRLARRHYENFTVVSWLLPRRLRQHVANVYAYCRWADDLADEIGDPGRSLALLDWWERQLGDCYQGRATHPVFVALAETIRKFNIPREPFLDLLAAFRQDQQVTRYETIEQVLEYCRYSANPVGRLVLHLGQCHTPERATVGRLDLHGPAIGQLLPGRGPRLGPRPRLSAAGGVPAVRLRRGDVCPARANRRLSSPVGSSG